MNRVPLGFICGYPVKSSGGEMYGGSMFCRSSARDTKQGKAIQEINGKWGDDFLNRPGRETIGVAVCKNKFNPFQFHVVEIDPIVSNSGSLKNSKHDKQKPSSQLKTVKVIVERLYGCRCHHPKRLEKMSKYGLRQGWHTYGVWSLNKAKAVAKREETRINREIAETGNFQISKDLDENDFATNNRFFRIKHNMKAGKFFATTGSKNLGQEKSNLKIIKTLNIPGNYTWKSSKAYDNILKEIHGYSESDTEEYSSNSSKMRQIATRRYGASVSNSKLQYNDIASHGQTTTKIHKTFQKTQNARI